MGNTVTSKKGVGKGAFFQVIYRQVIREGGLKSKKPPGDSKVSP